MRLLITGMGGELGTRVALMAESDRSVTDILGIDVDPPRRRLRRAEFRRVDPRDRRRVAEIVRDLAPTAVLHLGVYEPHARSIPETARARTLDGSIAALGAAAETGSLERIVVRSGIEVYGRRRGAPRVPDEEVSPDPTSPFGHTLMRTEAVAASAGEVGDVPVTALRMAPVVGAHVPSPLGRYLRLPLVPFSAFADPPFSMLHQEDAAAAVLAALHAGHDGPVNVCGPGAVTASQAARLGRRAPLPVVGPQWRAYRRATELIGSPVPPHVLELLTRGRTANATAAPELLGVTPAYTTPDIVKELYEWAPVSYLPVGEAAA